jgi:hypothetical protein
MKADFLKGCALILAVSLAGCSTMRGGGATNAGGIEATRFHLGQPVAKGQIAIEAFDPADVNMPEFPAYAGSVQRQLTRLGWTVAATNRQTEQVALIDVQQGSRAVLTGRVGGSAAIGAGASPSSVATLLEVRIRRRSDGTVIWEGRAISEAAAAAATGAQRSAAVEKLSEALFRDFPGESGRTIRLR